MSQYVDAWSAPMQIMIASVRSIAHEVAGKLSDDDDVYLINYNMAVGYEIYLHTNTNQPERNKDKMKPIRKIHS
jgi:FtsZ-interacting cell division protein ZipA